MLCLLRDLVVDQHWMGKKAYPPKDIHSNLSSEWPTCSQGSSADIPPDIKKGFNKNRQEDTHEFFRFVTDGLQNTALAPYPKYASPLQLRFDFFSDVSQKSARDAKAYHLGVPSVGRAGPLSSGVLAMQETLGHVRFIPRPQRGCQSGSEDALWDTPGFRPGGPTRGG